MLRKDGVGAAPDAGKSAAVLDRCLMKGYRSMLIKHREGKECFLVRATERLRHCV